ncbi:HEAT repeat domain-containing protein [Anaerolinea sp.]|uniref:HEAT repeat domain-containing protein n=1 Tax=Anaerolinea sp. TaxID=1872519 RepID=UPI002ACEC484|nr:HEAT repeat domain-containing protein [Anaerolinea sp.]
MARKPIPFDRVIKALLDESTPFSPTYLHRFSDLEEEELDALKQVWNQIQPTRRLALLSDLEEISDADTLVFFDNVARIALNDEHGAIRAQAIRLLWLSEDAELIPLYLNFLSDPEAEVRAEAAGALGKFVYLGELEELPEQTLHEIENRLIDVVRGKDQALVRRRALEALGFSSREEVPLLVREAYQTNDPDWVASALMAMGRSYDKEYEPEVKRMLKHPKVNVQLEAIRAAGELELESARRPLLDLLEEEAQDSEVRYAAIWALSQIGGEQVRETLEKIAEETEDDEELEIVEQALDNLQLNEEISMMMFDFDIEDEEDLKKFGRQIDLSKPEEEDEEE